MSSRILVTGGAGMIGTAVVRALLARGDQAVVLDSGQAAGFGYVEGTGAELIEADIRDSGSINRAVSDADAIVHLAAQASVPESIAQPVNDLQINVDASVALLEAARAAGVNRFVFASSNAVIGGHEPPAHEEQVPYPVSPYGAAKAAIEAYLRAYHEAFAMETVALRFANAYGRYSAHKSAVVAALIKRYLAGGPLRINGTGEQTRDFVHIDDVAAVVLACLDAPAETIANQVLQVGTGTETSLRTLADLIFEAGGGSVPIEHAPSSPGDVPRNVSDISKARRLLGYEPRVQLRDGIADTLQWFRDNWRS